MNVLKSILAVVAPGKKVIEASEETLDVPLEDQQLLERPICLRKRFIVGF